MCVSCLFTSVSVSWNHFIDYGQITLNFPPDFLIKIEALISKHYTSVFPMGVLTVIMSLFSDAFLSEIDNFFETTEADEGQVCFHNDLSRGLK